MILTPLTMLAVYTLVFGSVFNVRWGKADSTLAFSLVLFCGLIVVNAFNDVLTGSPGVVASNPNYVKKVVFPLEILPVVLVGSALASAAVALAVLAAGALLINGKLETSILLAPLVLLSLAPLLLGVGWAVAAIGVFVRDLQHTASIAASLVLFLSPVFFPAERMPETFRMLIVLNPLVVPIELLRAVALAEPMPTTSSLVIHLVVGALAMLLGLALFRRLKHGFADVL